MRAVNLIPAEQRTRATVGAGRSQGVAYALLALVAGVAVLAFAYGKADHQITSRRSQVAQVNARAQAAQAAAAQLAPYTSFVALRDERMQAVAQLVDSRFDWAHAFHELGRVLPRGVSLTSLEGSVGGTGSSSSSSGSGSKSSTGSSSGGSGATGASATSATPPGSVPVMTLSGCAANQAAVARTLNRLRLMDGVSEVTLQSSTKANAGSTGGAGASCPSKDPVFTIQLIFDPLPSAAAAQAASVSSISFKGSTR